MNKKNNIPPERLEQIKSMINSRAKQKVAEAEKVALDEKESAAKLNYETLNYIELFEALLSFNDNNFDLFQHLELLFDNYLAHGDSKNDQVFSSVTQLMLLTKEIASKGDFIREKKDEYMELSEELDQIF